MEKMHKKYPLTIVFVLLGCLYLLGYRPLTFLYPIHLGLAVSLLILLSMPFKPLLFIWHNIAPVLP